MKRANKPGAPCHDASLIAVFAAEAGEPVPSWHVASPRGGPRPGAGRPRRDPSAVSKPRSGPSMTDAEWAEVLDYAARAGVSPVEAMRRLIRAGLCAAGPAASE